MRANASGAGGVEALSIVKRFGSAQTPVVALGGVSLRVAAGEFVTLLGPSGCGKSTLLRVIAGLERPDSGAVWIGGEPMGDRPASRRPVNMVFQNYALFPHLNVFENIAFGLRARRLVGPDVERRVKEATAILRIDELTRRQPHELSGGQKQRVALARALVNEPQALLLDEPMSALDARLRAEVQLELRRLQRRLGRAFILVTHDQDEAMSVSDRIVVMRAGRVEQEGTPAEIYDRPANRFVAEFIGAANLIQARDLGAGMIETALGIFQMDQAPPWESGWVAVRPERIRISASQPDMNGVRVRITDQVFRGDIIEIFAEPNGLRARAPAATRVPVDEDVWFAIPPDAFHPLAD